MTGRSAPKRLSQNRVFGRFSCDPAPERRPISIRRTDSEPMRRSRISLALPALLALFAGCDSNPLEPGEVAAEWVLESVNGSALPASPWATPGFLSSILADTLRLQDDRRGTHVRVTRTDYPDPRPDEVFASTSTLGYRLRGDVVEMTYACPPNALCTAGPHTFGRLEGEALVVTEGEIEFRYRRL